MTDTLSVVDNGTVLTIPFESCVQYHGRVSIGGAAMGFRLLQRAFALLSPGGPPDRADIALFTAFPGLGCRDTVEMVTRAVTRDAYRVDTEAAVPGPEGVRGRLYFEVTIGDRVAKLSLVEGGMSPEFIAQGRRSKEADFTGAEQHRWTALKEALAVSVLAARPEDLFVTHD
jgi:hypothetical protein